MILGKDASRAFVTGDFTEAGLTDDVSDLPPSQIVALYDWLAFYQKDYTLVGRHVTFHLQKEHTLFTINLSQQSFYPQVSLVIDIFFYRD